MCRPGSGIFIVNLYGVNQNLIDIFMLYFIVNIHLSFLIIRFFIDMAADDCHCLYIHIFAYANKYIGTH